jgi:hypothetical protein
MKKISIPSLILLFLLPITLSAQTLGWLNKYDASPGYTSLLAFQDVVFDEAGNSYTASYIEGSGDADPGPGASPWSTGSSPSFMVQKVNVSGQVVWTRIFQGTGNLTTVYAIKMDKFNNLYITGATGGTIDADPGIGVSNISASGVQDGFFIKLNPDGIFQFARIYRSGRVSGISLDIDDTGNIYIGGGFDKTVDVDPGPGTITLTQHAAIFNDNNAGSGFATKLDASGNYLWHFSYLFSTITGASRPKIKLNGNVEYEIYVGESDSSDVDPGPGVFKAKRDPNPQNYNQYLFGEFTPSGQFVTCRQRVFFQTIGTSNEWRAIRSKKGENYAYGRFAGTVDLDPTANVQNFTAEGAYDGFIVRLNDDYEVDTIVILGGPGHQQVYTYNGMDVDSRGVMYFNYYTSVTQDIDSDPNHTQMFFNNCFLKLDKNFYYAGHVNSNTYAGLLNPKVNNSKKIYFLGENYSGSTSYDVEPGPGVTTFQPQSNGYSSFMVQWVSCPGPTYSNVNYVACGTSIVSPSGLYTYTSAGVYQDTIVNKSGCDSIMTLNVSFQSATYSSFNAFACIVYTAPSGATFSQSGVYNDTIPNSIGCDSVMTINVTIGEILSSISPEVCVGPYLSPGGYSYATSGVYEDTLVAVNGCDSIIEINLTIHPAYHENRTVLACGQYTLPSGVVVTQNGVYQDQLATTEGCDSTFTIDVTFPVYQSTETVASCFYHTLPSGQIVTVSGQYQSTILSSAGCDSVITTNLTIKEFTIPLLNASPTVATTLNNGLYQWLDCNNNFSVISGAQSKTYTAVQNGSYAVQVTFDGCIDTSACLQVGNVGLIDLSDVGMEIFPNPARDQIQIRLHNQVGAHLKIFDAAGKLILEQALFSKELSVSVSSFDRGLYFIEINQQGKITREKILFE